MDVTLPVTLSDEGIRLCVVCENSLEGRRVDATTCSDACRKAKSRGRTAEPLDARRLAKWTQAAEVTDWKLHEWIRVTCDIAAKHLVREPIGEAPREPEGGTP